MLAMFVKNYQEKVEQLIAKVEESKKPAQAEDDEDVFVIIGDSHSNQVSHLFDKDFQDLDLKYSDS